MNSPDRKYSDNNALVNGLNERREGAMEELFHRLYPPLCWFANKFIDDREAARDVVQEVFVRFYERRDNRFESFAGVMSFLYNSVHNRAIDCLRRSRRTVQMACEHMAEYEGADELAFAEAESVVYMKIFEAVERLPGRMRKIFVMSYVERLSVREVSSRLGIAETTVKTQRQRAKRQLQDWLKDHVPLLSLLFF